MICLRQLLFFRFFSEFRRTAAFGPIDAHNQYPLLTRFCSTNDSVGWLPVDHHLLVLLQRPQHQQQHQHVLLQHLAVLLRYTLLQHLLSSKDNASTSRIILAAASQNSAATVLTPGSTSEHMKVNVTATSVRRCPLSGPTSRSCTGGSVGGTNQGKNIMMPASPRRQGVSSTHPPRYQGFDPTIAQVITLYIALEAIGQKFIKRT